MLSVSINRKEWEGVCHYAVGNGGGLLAALVSVNDNRSFHAVSLFNPGDLKTRIRSDDAELAEVIALYDALKIRQAVQP